MWEWDALFGAPIGPSIIGLWLVFVLVTKLYLKSLEKIFEIKESNREETLKSYEEQNVIPYNWHHLLMRYLEWKQNHSLNNWVEILCEEQFNKEELKIPLIKHHILKGMKRCLIVDMLHEFFDVPERLLNKRVYHEARERFEKSYKDIKEGKKSFAESVEVEELNDTLPNLCNLLKAAILQEYDKKEIPKDVEKMKKFVLSTPAKLRKENEDLISLNSKSYKAKTKARKERKDKLDKMCGTVCGAFGATWENVISKPSKGTWKFICQFFSYAKAMLKANKQKACP